MGYDEGTWLAEVGNTMGGVTRQAPGHGLVSLKALHSEDKNVRVSDPKSALQIAFSKGSRRFATVAPSPSDVV